MQSILVTGANGFVGSHLVKQLSTLKFNVVATGSSRQAAFALPVNVQYHQLDFTNRENVVDVLSVVKPRIVVHSGAMSKPDDCEKQKEKAMLTNVEGTKNLLEEATCYQSHFIFLSTDFVFSGDTGMYSEEDVRSPVNFYGQTKVQAENAVMAYPFPWSIARTVLVYGNSINNKPTFVESIVATAQRNEQLRIFEDQVRTPTYVGDLVKGVLSIIERKATGIFHLSGEDCMTVYQAAMKAVDFNGCNTALITPIKEGDLVAPARRPKITGFNLTKAKTILDYQPISFEEGLRLTFRASEI